MGTLGFDYRTQLLLFAFLLFIVSKHESKRARKEIKVIKQVIRDLLINVVGLQVLLQQ
jgi:hypothetical protein